VQSQRFLQVEVSFFSKVKWWKHTQNERCNRESLLPKLTFSISIASYKHICACLNSGYCTSNFASAKSEKITFSLNSKQQQQGGNFPQCETFLSSYFVHWASSYLSIMLQMYYFISQCNNEHITINNLGLPKWLAKEYNYTQHQLGIWISITN